MTLEYQLLGLSPKLGSGINPKFKTVTRALPAHDTARFGHVRHGEKGLGLFASQNLLMSRAGDAVFAVEGLS
jgi:hypothetical protein